VKNCTVPGPGRLGLDLAEAAGVRRTCAVVVIVDVALVVVDGALVVVTWMPAAGAAATDRPEIPAAVTAGPAESAPARAQTTAASATLGSMTPTPHVAAAT